MDVMSAQDRRDLEELERASRRSRSSENNGLDEKVTIDCTDAAKIGVVWPEGKHPFEVTKVEKKQSQARFDEKRQEMKEGGTPYTELELTCIGGDMRGETISDRLMLAGKGLSRFVIFADAIGMYNKENKSFTGRLSDFLGQQVWAAVVTEKSTYQGRDRERSIIDFAGYEPITAYPMPDAVPFEVDGNDSYVEEKKNRSEIEDDEVMEGEVMEGEVMEGEAEMELPVPSPPSHSHPTARRATAVAGSAGTKPPWTTKR